jgi:hypothetical protein
MQSEVVVESVSEKRRSSEQILGIISQPEFTCPQINEVIREIGKALKIASSEESDCRRCKPDCEHGGRFSDIRYHLDGIENALEKLRAQNDAIRGWGEEWKNATKKLLDKYEPSWRRE